MDLWSPCGVHMESVGECKVQSMAVELYIDKLKVNCSSVCYGLCESRS